jgi:hypothetical protein
MAIYFLSSVQPKPIMENVKKAVSATNPAIRSAAMNLIGTLYLYMGPQLLAFFEDEKSQVQQQIQAEFDKVKFIVLFTICKSLRHLCIALVIQRTIPMRHTVLSSVASPALLYFSTLY